MGIRRVVLLIAATVTALLLASGVALAAALTGTNKPDYIVGTKSSDSIAGLDGADLISGDPTKAPLREGTPAGDDTISGGGGNDVIIGDNSRIKRDSFIECHSPGFPEGNPYWTLQYSWASADEISGDDSMLGGEGCDFLVGMYGSDTIVGGPDADVIFSDDVDEDRNEKDDGTSDVVYGGGGNDLLSVRDDPANKDHVSCGSGHDQVAVDRADVAADDCEFVY